MKYVSFDTSIDTSLEKGEMYSIDKFRGRLRRDRGERTRSTTVRGTDHGLTVRQINYESTKTNERTNDVNKQNIAT